MAMKTWQRQGIATLLSEKSVKNNNIEGKAINGLNYVDWSNAVDRGSSPNGEGRVTILKDGKVVGENLTHKFAFELVGRLIANSSNSLKK
jgi:hypothetical protein